MGLKTGDVLHERYRIGRVLGRGGMGVVYRAWDGRLEVPVAIKEMSPQVVLSPEKFDQLREQFVQEAHILARLNHPHLVRVSDCFSQGGAEYLVMDFAEGENLVQWIRRRGALPEEQVLDWAGQLLDALAYCHDNGVYHRDVKPQNVIVGPDGRAVLVDFGLVKQVDAADQRTMTVIRGMGTPEYAPPEQCGYGDAHTDARSDIYSLGATLYHLLTGRAPPTVTQRTADPELLKPIRRVQPRVSMRTAAAVDKALQLARKDRWASAREMAAALGASGPVILRAGGRHRSFSRSGGTLGMDALPRRRFAWLGGLASVMAIIAIVLMVISLRAGGNPFTRQTKTPTSETPIAAITWTLVSGSGATATPTWTAVSVATRRPTSTKAPTSTPTEIPTVTPKPTEPTPVTVQPTPTPVPEPTATSVPPTPTTQPTATSVPPTATPTERWLAAPRLLSPENGASFAGWNAEVVLTWSSVGSLLPNEYYVVSIPYDAAGSTATFWRKETQLKVPPNYSSNDVGFADRHYNWWVQVMACTQNCAQALDDNIRTSGYAVGTASARGLFYWGSDVGAGPKPTNTPPEP